MKTIKHKKLEKMLEFENIEPTKNAENLVKIITELGINHCVVTNTKPCHSGAFQEKITISQRVEELDHERRL